jgi:UDP-N-acetylmuramoyl-L-alanyl-D-glutamate--2,6-diaminopimelate ligase
MCRVVDAGGRAAEAKTRVAPGHPGAGRTACEAVATIRSMTSAGTRAEFVGPWGRFEGTTRMVGRHNVTNALQALAAAWCVGVVPRCLEEQIAAAAAPAGRLEPVTSESHGFAVLVDYAHTDDALEKALATVRPLVERGGRLTVVFGCGGDRDTSKRPLMGAVAARGADAVIVTSDNPRTEAASAIAEQILAGIPASSRSKVTVELDRRVAIRAAVADARRGDVVLIAGKGHEDYQILPDGRGGTIKTVFDDRVVAREALAASTGTRAVGGA